MTKRRTPIKARTYRKRRSTRSRTTRRGRTARRGRLNEMERRLKVSKRRNTRRRNVNRRNTRGGSKFDEQTSQYAEDVTTKLRELEENLIKLNSMDGGMESLIWGLGDLVVKNESVVVNDFKENGGGLMKGLINELENLVTNQLINKEKEKEKEKEKDKAKEDEASAAPAYQKFETEYKNAIEEAMKVPVGDKDAEKEFEEKMIARNSKLAEAGVGWVWDGKHIRDLLRMYRKSSPS